MKRISLTLILCLYIFLGYSQEDYKFDPGYRVPDNTTHYYKFAVLPTSSSGTGEMLTVKLIGGSFFSDKKKIENMYFGNRNGFRAFVPQKYGAIWDYVRIEAYKEVNGSISIYFVMDHSYSHGKIIASASGIISNNILQVNPQKTTEIPSGTIVFSSIDETGGIQVLSDGKVGIGTTTTGTHKLAVNGTIGAREIKVEATGWSDFVFEDDYQLKNLEEVESYITKNNHLPDVPSEKEVLENGIQLGEMNAKLLQKIEELTLYLIKQNKRTNKLIEENKDFRKEIENLRKRIK
ncbi:hypothetical protein [Labilibaculum euxinus]